MSGATWAVAHEIYQGFYCSSSQSYEIYGKFYNLIFSISSNRMFWVVLDRDPLEKCSVIAVAPQSSILCPILCLLYSSSSV